MSLQKLVAGDVRPLEGTLLSLPLRKDRRAAPRIVAAFVQSLDGRIALDGRVPQAIANARDWRLFQELAAQADLVLMASRFVREAAAGVAQAPPPLDAERFPDLIAWRRQQGLAAQPALWILASGRGELPKEPLRQWAQTRSVCVLAQKPLALPDGVRFLHWPEPRVLRKHLADEGVRVALFAAGGHLHRTMLSEGLIDELWLTLRLRVLGGKNMRTIAEGEVLRPPADFSLADLWLDAGIAPPQLLLRLVRLEGGDGARS